MAFVIRLLLIIKKSSEICKYVSSELTDYTNLDDNLVLF